MKMMKILILLILIFPLHMAGSNSILAINGNKSLKVLIITGGHDFEREAFFDMFDSFSNMTYQEIQHPQANDFLKAENAEPFDK